MEHLTIKRLPQGTEIFTIRVLPTNPPDKVYRRTSAFYELQQEVDLEITYKDLTFYRNINRDPKNKDETHLLLTEKVTGCSILGVKVKTTDDIEKFFTNIFTEYHYQVIKKSQRDIAFRRLQKRGLTNLPILLCLDS